MSNPTGAGCVVLVPCSGSIEPECESSLQVLESRGYTVWRVGGYAQIDLGRSQMATDALAAGFEWTMWIDSDIGFNADDVDRLRSHHQPIIAGLYAKKGKRELAAHLYPKTTDILFGIDGGLVEAKYVGCGFMLVHRRVYDAIRTQLQMPVCNQTFGNPITPYFLSMLMPIGDDDHWYLGEDYAFCERSRQCGHSIFIDTTIRLTHYGRYGYTWEDAGNDRPAFASYRLHLGGQSD